jgi:hypothetical protein
VLQETLLFPYLSGADFMHRFEEHDPGQVPYGSRLPVSTEQVMHDAAYFGNPPDLPTHVTLPAPTGATSTYDNDVGEFETRLFLYQHLKDQPLAVRAAAGWDGDRYAVLKTAHGDGIVWVSVWDTPFDAAEFSDALGQVMAKRYPNATPQTIAGGKRWTTSGRTISVWGGEIAGRPAVMYVDVPVGANPSPIDPAKVTLK